MTAQNKLYYLTLNQQENTKFLKDLHILKIPLVGLLREILFRFKKLGL